MSMLRSEPMQLVQIISDNESARAVVTALGDAALVHFRDLKGETPMRRPAARRTEDDGYETLKLF